MKTTMNLAIALTVLSLTFNDAVASSVQARAQNIEKQMIELNQIQAGIDLKKIAFLEADLSRELGCCNIGRALGNVAREAGKGVGNVIRETNRGVNNVARELNQAKQVWANIQREATKAYNDLRVLVDKIANIEQWTQAAHNEIKTGGAKVIEITNNIVRETGTAVVKIQAVTQQVNRYGTMGIELVVYSKISRTIIPDDLIQVAEVGLDAFKMNNDLFVLAVNESMRLSKFPGYLHNKGYNDCMAENIYKDMKNYILLGDKEKRDRGQECFNESMVELDKDGRVSPEEYEKHKKEVAEMEAQAQEEKKLLAENKDAQIKKDEVLAAKAEEKRILQQKLDTLNKYQEELQKIADRASAIQEDTQDLLNEFEE